MGDSLAAVNLGTGRTATAVTAAGNHTCALLDNASVKCWGFGSAGQLGQGDGSNRGDGAGEMGDNLAAIAVGTGRLPTAVTVGNAHTCVRLDNATVKCWSENNKGQLGRGDTDRRGDGAGEMGDSLAVISLGTARTASSVSVGNLHTCALLDNGTVKCWGFNASGRLGLGDTANRGDAAGEMGDALPAVSLGTGRTATSIAVGGSHTCALLDNNTVKCWGLNLSGQLGLADVAARGDAAGEMGDSLPAVSLGVGRTATAIATGTSHTCALLDNHTVKCWGLNTSGQLGQGDTANRGDAAGEMGNGLPAISLGTGRTATAIAAGNAISCALLDNGTVKCWGLNNSGHLGLGDTVNRGDAAGEMGDALVPVDLGSGAAAGVSGTVTDAVSGAPVAGAMVGVMRQSDFVILAGAVADGSGNYAVTVPPGSYFVYVMHRTGAHVAGFFGSPTTVTVAAGTFTDTDPTIAPTRGSITGTITEDGTGTPIGGAFAVTLGGASTAPEIATVANGSGAFTVAGLNPGSHFLGLIDPAGNHATEFHPNSPNVPDSTPVAVTAGDATVANGALSTQAATPVGVALTGTITEAATGVPLQNVFVFAMHAADFRLARATVTNPAGAYNFDLQAGSYKLVFLDATGLHNMEWHNNQPATGIGNAASVTAPAVVNAALDRNTGTMSGTITDDPSGAPIAGAWVLAIGPTGIAGGAITAADGTYTVTGLSPGTYRAAFVDPNDGHTLEYFDGATDFAGADPFNITAATNTPISAALSLP